MMPTPTATKHTLQDTLQSLIYQVPNGKVDVAYAYVFDATKLTDGISYNKLGMLLDPDSDFILRRIVGGKLVAGKLRTYYASQRFMQQNLFNTVANWPVLPETLYQAGSQIPFDLGTVARAFTADTVNIYLSYLAFFGVRRFDINAFPVYRTPYQYKLIHKEYEFALNMNYAHWTGAGNGVPTAPVQYIQPITEGDFELCQIRVTKYANGARVATNDFQMSLYDGRGQYRLSNIPLNLNFFDANAPAPLYQPCYPAESQVYPVNGAIKFEITSMLPFGTAGQYVIQFVGMERRPL
jgi:hypothetical protein